MGKKMKAPKILDQWKNILGNGELNFLSKLKDSINNPTPKSTMLPYEYFDQEKDIFHNESSSIGFVLEAMPVVGCDNNMQKQLKLLFEDTLPEGGCLQFLLLASHKIDVVLDEWLEARDPSHKVLGELANKRIDYFQSLVADQRNALNPRNFRLIISYSVAANSTKALREVCLFREQLESILSSCGIWSKKYKAQDLLELVDEIVNFEPSTARQTVSYNPLQKLKTQLSFPDHRLCVADNVIHHNKGEHLTKCYQVKSYPEEFSIGLMINMLGDSVRDSLQIPARFMIEYTVCKNISASRTEALKMKGQGAVKQAESFFARFNFRLKEEAKEWKDISQRVNKGEKFLTSMFRVAVTSPAAGIHRTEQQMTALYNYNGWRLVRSDYIHLPSFIGMLPMTAGTGLYSYLSRLGLTRTVLSSEPLAISPIHAEWRGSTSPSGMMLMGRRGQLFNWDPFQGESNYNACVIGQSGSGKSVFLQEIITSQLARGAKVFVLDIGRSFETTSLNLGDGDYIEFNSESNICLNPFSNIPTSNTQEEEDFLSLVSTIIARMVAPKKGTSDIEDAIIAEAIKTCWTQYGNATDISKIAEYLDNKSSRSDSKEKNISKMLFKYTERGTYGRFFNGKANIGFKNKFTLIEFEELRERPDLLEVIMQMFAVQIMQQIFLSDRKQRFVIMFDEASFGLMQFPKMLANISKTIRKYNGSLILGTQSIDDFFKNTTAISVLENSAWLCMLKQKKESLELLKKAGKISLSDSQISLVSTLEMRSGKYSEVLISSSGGGVVGRLVLDPFSNILYSTKPDEFNAVRTLIKSGLEPAIAVTKIAEQVYGK
jgi:conjugal transfer ATP-binding protein TraC